MKFLKTSTIAILILLSIIISLISFVGIYKQKDYKIINVVNKYLFGMEFKGSQVINFKVDDGSTEKTYDKDGNIVDTNSSSDTSEYTEENGYKIVEEKINKKENLNQTNYNQVIKILNKRISLLKAEQYSIREKEDYSISLELPNKITSQTIIEVISQSGKFEMIDEKTNEVLMNNSLIKTASVVYGQDADGSTKVYLQILFNKDGIDKLKKISKTYIKQETKTDNTNLTTLSENNTENSTSTDTTKNVSIKFDGTTYMTTYFGEEIADGKLNILIGQDATQTKIQSYMQKANQMQILINSGVMPIIYKTSVETTLPMINLDFSNFNTVIFILISSFVIYIIYMIYMIIKFKLKGFFVSIIQLGYVGLLLLIIRYTNVVLTIEGLIGIAFSIILSIILGNMLLKNKEERYEQKLIKYTYKIIPILIISIVFSFGQTLETESFGMAIFWGILITYLYSFPFIKSILKILE